MYARQVKFGLKIPNRLGKNVRQSRGGGILTHTVHQSIDFIIWSTELTS